MKRINGYVKILNPNTKLKEVIIMIREFELDENGKYKFPYKCPICKKELSPEENIDYEQNNFKNLLKW